MRDATVRGVAVYKQAVEGHTGFRWLKDAADVAPLFLKLPHRIAALGHVFLLALMVRNWIEGTLRARLAERGEKLPDMNDRPTSRPSAEAAMRLFALVQGIQVSVDAQIVNRQVHRRTPDAERGLALLDMAPAVDWTPMRKLAKGAGGWGEMRGRATEPRGPAAPPPSASRPSGRHGGMIPSNQPRS